MKRSIFPNKIPFPKMMVTYAAVIGAESFTASMLASETDCDPICLENKAIHIPKVSTKSFSTCPEDASKFSKKKLYHLILVHHVLYQAGYISLMSQQRWPKNNANVLSCHPVDIWVIHHPEWGGGKSGNENIILFRSHLMHPLLKQTGRFNWDFISKTKHAENHIHWPVIHLSK